jgi:CheY-like chemotaxis protein
MRHNSSVECIELTSMALQSARASQDLVKGLYGIQAASIHHRSPALVLIVDDSAMARVYAVIAVEDAGYSVLLAENAEGALGLLATHPGIGALFTDVRMPGGMDGLELAAEARRLRPDLGILIASGKVEPQEDDLPERSFFVSKPYAAPAVALALGVLLAEAPRFEGAT